MKISILSILFLFPQNFLFAGPIIPEGCIKSVEKVLENYKIKKAELKTNPQPYLEPYYNRVVSLFSLIPNALREVNENKPGPYIKKLSKKYDVSPKYTLLVLKKDPSFFCPISNQKLDINNLERTLKKFKNIEKNIQILSRIDKQCSPNAIIKKLKQIGRYYPTRFSKPLSKLKKFKAKGYPMKFGKTIKGRNYRVKWIYHEENGFTDPLKHNENKYQYLIHMIDPQKNVATHRWFFEDTKEYFNKLAKTSLSLVNQNDTTPFGLYFKMGALVEMDSKSLWATSHMNMGSDVGHKLKNLNNSFPIIPPAEIFKRGRRLQPNWENNEIVSIKGSDIIGYVLFKDKSGLFPWYEYSEKRLLTLLKACTKRNLPVVYLKRDYVIRQEELRY